MNTTYRFQQPTDRDAERVANDLTAVQAHRGETPVARVARHSWQAVRDQWRIQMYLQNRLLQINAPWLARPTVRRA